MKVLVISSTLNNDTRPLVSLFEENGFQILTKWIGGDDWPQLDADVCGVVMLTAKSHLETMELLVEIRQRTRKLHIPIIVVPHEFGQETKARYISAGATEVCTPDETNERIVAEILSRQSSLFGDLTKMRLELLQPFIAATLEALEIMGGIKIKVNEVYRKSEYDMAGDISGLIYLIGKTERMLAVSFPAETAKNIAFKVLDGVVEEPDDEIITDCVGEVVNIVAGQVKGRFVHTEFEFDISTPSIITGTNHQIRHRSDLPCYVITFSGKVGKFALQLCVRASESGAEEC